MFSREPFYILGKKKETPYLSSQAPRAFEQIPMPNLPVIGLEEKAAGTNLFY